MRLTDLIPIDQEHERRAQYSNAVGTPYHSRIARHRFKFNTKGNTSMAKSVEGKKAVETKKEAAAPTWGTKQMADRLKVDAKRLRTILRAADKGLKDSGEGRYSWKPNDEVAIAKVKKIVDTFEAAAEERKAKAAENKKEEAAPKKKAAKKAVKANGKKVKAKKEDEDEEVFEEEEEEEEAAS